MRLTEPAKPLDAASAQLFRFVPQVRLKSSPYVGSNVRAKRLKVFDGRSIGAGAMIDGPAIIEEPTTTFLLLPGQVASVDGYGNYIVEIG